MPRGVVPRQPVGTGRQDKVRAARPLMSAKSNQKLSVRRKMAIFNQRRPSGSGH